MNVSAATGIKGLKMSNSYDGIAKDDYVMIVDGTNSVDGKDPYTRLMSSKARSLLSVTMALRSMGLGMTSLIAG